MFSANSQRRALSVTLISRDPAMQRWITSGATGGDVDVVALAPADWDIASATQADIILVATDAGCPRDLDLIEKLSTHGVQVVALAAGGSISLAVDAMRRGAADFILQPARAQMLFDRLRELVAQRPQLSSSKTAATRPDRAANPAGFIGQSKAMQALYAQISRAAPSSAPVFVTGESGTGKELCANGIHELSGRKADRFVAINCAAIPRDLMESELFGHVRGAFTGANDDRPGAMQLADGGTLFLDEICEMDLSLQAKLLRALQTNRIRRVGGTSDESVDVRIVCATNRDPQGEMDAGRFRADLFYRLHVLPVHLPALRERGADILELARSFLTRFSAEEGRHFRGFDPRAEQFLAGYDWPGNVRQLENLVRRIVVMHDGEMVSAQMIPLALAQSGAAGAVPGRAGADILAFGNAAGAGGSHAQHGIEPFWIQEKRIIEKALETFDGHVGKAAAALEISASTIYRKKLGWDGDPAMSA
ncbi:MAG: sigma-54-dependent Fis family transcriptional regulator [Rhodobiaceae bacterium]|nr:sigma-54-dependent Fis family transcriptional regulator [Rhodobiaceae bacterium]MCC0040645.1 sigma-54-dependent Fis family transcriptional regulator [Rhodobiaceae bacterium]